MLTNSLSQEFWGGIVETACLCLNVWGLSWKTQILGLGTISGFAQSYAWWLMLSVDWDYWPAHLHRPLQGSWSPQNVVAGFQGLVSWTVSQVKALLFFIILPWKSHSVTSVVLCWLRWLQGSTYFQQGATQTPPLDGGVSVPHWRTYTDGAFFGKIRPAMGLNDEKELRT